MRSSPAPVWIVAGAPGAGMTTVADLLRTGLDPRPALLDKDVLFAGFVTEVQDAHGRSRGEREGPWYDEHVKPEYTGMTRAAAQIRAWLPGHVGRALHDPDPRPDRWYVIADPAALRWNWWVSLPGSVAAAPKNAAPLDTGSSPIGRPSWSGCSRPRLPGATPPIDTRSMDAVRRQISALTSPARDTDTCR